MERTTFSATCLRRLRAAGAAAAALLLFSAGTCHVSYCSRDDREHCDPCVSVCRCDEVCAFALEGDARVLFGLRSYELVTTADSGGAWSRSYRSIVGPSVERAFGERELSRELVELFARNVVRRNETLFGPLEAWEAEAVERTDAGILVRFAREGDEHGSLLLWLDPRGRLLEIEHRGRL